MAQRWRDVLLGLSLAINLAGLGLWAWRRLHPAPEPDAYQRGRRELFEVLASSAPSFGSSPVAAQPQQPGTRVVMLGDSLTDFGEWQELLGRCDVVNRGIGADTLARARARLDAIVLLQPRAVVVMLGINDLLHGHSLDHTLAEHAALMQELHERLPQARIVVQGLLPVRPGGSEPVAIDTALVRRANDGLRAAASSPERASYTSFVDVGAAMIGPDGELDPDLTTDGLHLSGRGYLRWRDALAGELARLLPVLPPAGP